MKSEIIIVDSHENGFTDAVEETGKIAALSSLGKEDAIRLQLITEEMLSLVRMVTGELQFSFWVECEDGQYQFHLATKTLMDKEKRYLLLSSSSSRKNEAAKSLLGKLRDMVEQALLREAPNHSDSAVPDELGQDIYYHPETDPEWDHYERSVLRKIADDIRIGIRGGQVDMTVSKRFA